MVSLGFCIFDIIYHLREQRGILCQEREEVKGNGGRGRGERWAETNKPIVMILSTGLDNSTAILCL